MNELRLDDVHIDLDGASDDPIIIISVNTPNGCLEVCGEVIASGRVLHLVRVHVQSDAGPNGFGWGVLRRIAALVVERLDIDELRIEGAARTTGASPGHHPRHMRLTRRGGAPS